jgi:hypothetical protein
MIIIEDDWIPWAMPWTLTKYSGGTICG